MEKETGIRSKEFYRQFQEGKWGDEMKYIRWAGEYETLEATSDKEIWVNCRNCPLCSLKDYFQEVESRIGFFPEVVEYQVTKDARSLHIGRLSKGL